MSQFEGFEYGGRMGECIKCFHYLTLNVERIKSLNCCRGGYFGSNTESPGGSQSMKQI